MAAKTSASAAFNSYFYQQQHQQQHSSTKQQQQMDANSTSNNSNNTTNNNNNNNEAAAVSDLHLKMSKKIAQLTKVIYALNSKNDETENLLSSLKAQYEDDKEQFITETNRKLEEFKYRLINNNDQTKQIRELEQKLKEYQSEKGKALKDFEQFKLKSIEREESLTLAHKDELIEMNRIIEQLKHEQEKQLKHFELVASQYQSEKTYLIEDLKSKHRLELENLKQSLFTNKDAFKQERKILEDKHQNEINKLKLELDDLMTKSNQEKSEHEHNILKLKSFHEKELDAYKQNTSNQYSSVINNLKLELDQLNKQKLNVEQDLNKKLNLKLEEILNKEDEMKILNEKLKQLESKIQMSNTNESSLTEKLMELNVDNQRLQTKLAELEIENASNKDQCKIHEKTLIEKSAEINKLEASNMQNTSTISDLNHELNVTKQRLLILENDRRSLETESSTLNDRNTQLIRSLEKQIDSLNNQIQNEKNDYEKNLKQLVQSNENNLEKLKTDFKIEKEDLISNYENRLNTEKAQFDEKILTLERNLTRDFNAENEKLLNERNDLRSQLDKLMEELKFKTKQYDNELKTLNESLSKNEKILNKLTKTNEDLTKKNELIQNDNTKLKEETNKNLKQIESLSNELEQLKILYETSSKDSQLELKVKLEKVTKELNSKWSETIRTECDNLRKELQIAKEDEKRQEVDRITNLKDQELKNQKTIWQTKTNELLDEISLLKRALNEKEVKLNEQFDKVKAGLEMENKLLSEQLERIKNDYNSKLDEIKSKQSLENKLLIDNLIKENEAKIAELKNRHLEDLKSQTVAQKAAMASLKASLESSKSIEIEMLNQNHNKKLDLAKQDAELKFYTELDKLRQENEKEMLVLRVELDRAIEIAKQKDRESELKLEEFQSEMRLKQKHIDKINDEIRELKHYNTSLKEDLDFKVKELKQVKHEVQLEIKNKEILMQQRKEEEMNRLNGEHMKQKQTLVNEFKRAQDLLKEKINESELALREMHDRYLNRESRPEDIELIQALRKSLNEREELIRKLQDEKKYFQMELVNRETNFNKMFNVIPNVGTINPLNSNTKIKIKGLSTSNGKLTPQSVGGGGSGVGAGGGTSSSGARLEPIPGVGSPLHDITLNPNKPLPKKFLS